MTAKGRFTSWRPAVGLLALGLVAIGLSMRGASAQKGFVAPPDAPATSSQYVALVPAEPSAPQSEPLAELPVGDARVHVIQPIANKYEIGDPRLAQFDTWLDGAWPETAPRVRATGAVSSREPQSVDGGTAGPPVGACCTSAAPGSCVCDFQTMADCTDPDETYLGDNTLCGSSVCDCNGNGICDGGEALPDCDMDGLLDVCNDACVLRACCNNLTGLCIGDLSEADCVGTAGRTWHPNASCTGLAAPPWSALPPPVCNLAGTCDWDNGAVLDDRGRPRIQHFIDAFLTSAVADDFILIDLANPNNPCLMTDVVVHCTHATPPNTQTLDGVNVTVYEELAAPTACESDADCVAPDGNCVGANPTCPPATDCFCSGNPKGPAGYPLDPTNEAQVNTHISTQAGGVVYSQFIPFDGVPVANAGLCDPTERVCVIRLANLPCGEETSRVEVNIDPNAPGLSEISPLILNKNRKYWFEFQAVTGDIPLSGAASWFDYRSVNGTGHRAVRGFGSDPLSFWTDDINNTGAAEVGCNAPAANTRHDMTFQLTGDKLPAIPPVANDLCANRITVSDGAAAFNSAGATTDGLAPGSPGLCAPPPAPTCNCLPAPADNITKDVWYEYTSSCFGILTIDTCGSAFDTALAVYSELIGACPPAAGTQIACNNNSNSCGAGSLQSEVTVLTEVGETYLIRVGGHNGQSGKGIVAIRCIDACGDPQSSACCSPPAPPALRPGCTNAACCDIVCAIDPGCCGAIFPFVWDQECADLADSEPACQCPCNPSDPTVPPTAACTNNEPEACGVTNVNWGCNPPVGSNILPFRSTLLTCGQTWCGNVFANAGVADQDWYRFVASDVDMDGKSNVRITLVSDVPAEATLQENDCLGPCNCANDAACGGDPSCNGVPPCVGGFCTLVSPAPPVQTFGFVRTASCEPEILDTCVTAGLTYYIQVKPSDASGNDLSAGFACGTQTAYKLTVECLATCPTGSCCSCGGSCFGPEDALACRARGPKYGYAGNGVPCTPSPCLAHRSALATEVFCGTPFTYDNRNLAPCTTDASCASVTPIGSEPECDTPQNQCRLTPEPFPDCGTLTHPADPVTGTMWVYFTATATSVSVSTCGSMHDTSIDSVMTLYTVNQGPGDACESLALVPGTCIDDSGGTCGRMTRFCATGLTVGNEYYLLLASYFAAALGQYDVVIECPCQGACCDTNAGTCVDNASQTACNTRFVLDTACSALFPPCGQGACCLPNGTCNATALTLAQCNTAGGYWRPGGNCQQTICGGMNVPETCEWDNGFINFLSRASASQWSPNNDPADAFFFEVADDFILLGDTQTETNDCEIESVRVLFTHGNYSAEDVPPGPCAEGGSPGACFDTPEDYVSIRVTIYEDTGGPFDGLEGGKGPAGQPNDPPDGGHNPAPDPVDGPILYSITVAGPPLKSAPPSGNWFEFDPGPGGFGEDWDVTIHFNPPLAVAKNKKNWMAVAPELPLATYYQTFWVRSNNFNGNRGQQFAVADGNGVFTRINLENGEDPGDFCFQINGAKATLQQQGCGCAPNYNLFGDIHPPTDGNCTVDLDDILCVLDDFGGLCGGLNDVADVAPCGGGGGVDLDDILAILDAFAQDFLCVCN